MSENVNDGGPAFPYVEPPGFSSEVTPGLTKREWFAGMALANINLQSHISKPSSEALAESAFNIADAMIERRTR